MLRLQKKETILLRVLSQTPSRHDSMRKREMSVFFLLSKIFSLSSYNLNGKFNSIFLKNK